MIYAEGGRSRSGELGEPKPGSAGSRWNRARRSCPVAIHGSAKVRRWKRLRFPKVTVQYGEPLSFPREESPSRERQLEVGDRDLRPVREMYERAGAYS